MNAQVRRLFGVILLMFLVLGCAITLVQFVNAPSLIADGRNSRSILQATERDRGAIIVADEPIAYSERLENSSQYQRTYSQGELYAPITGFFSAVNMYATGMESAAADILEGDNSQLFWQRMRDLLAGRSRQGGGVALTVDPDLQETAAEALGDRTGAAVVLEVTTGKILALYSSPSYDPNPLASLDATVAQQADAELQADPSRPLNNRAIASDTSPPGSVFKILTSVAMLEEGITTETELDSPQTITLPGTETTLSNIEGLTCGSGKVSLTEAFARSCNTTFALAAEGIGQAKLAEVATRFGFGESISVPMKVTASYFPDKTDAAQLAMSAIGQFNVSTTPMQMAQVTQAIANGGVMMQPYLIDQILNADNEEVSTTSPSILSTPVTKEIASSIGTMMEAVVNESYGTGQSMAIPGVRVAAKTGTAEVGDGSQANAWAVAYAPADNPQIAVAVMVEGDEANPVPHGGEVAGPIVKQLLEVGLQ